MSYMATIRHFWLHCLSSNSIHNMLYSLRREVLSILLSLTAENEKRFRGNIINYCDLQINQRD